MCSLSRRGCYTRLVPLKSSAIATIPRVELNAAKLAVKLALTVQSELKLDLQRTIFWSDSSTVLKYLHNENRRFQRFVANRIAFVREHSNVADWKHVPTNLNPADVASRGVSAAFLLEFEMWKKGPEFLWQPEDKWPHQKEFVLLNSDDPELLKQKKVLCTRDEVISPTDILLRSSSSWFKTKLRVAWMLRLKRILRGRCSTPDEPISCNELQQAEDAIWNYVQVSLFPNSVRELSKVDPEYKDSRLKAILIKEKLHKLHPIISDGLLRVGGRISGAEVSFNVKHPIILSRDHYLVKIVVTDLHRSLGHFGKERLLTELRQKYWIVGGNGLARQIVRDCIQCRKRQGRPGTQIMADLPEERLHADQPLFSFIGIDAFGPFLVTRGRGRAKEKRYGIVFSCMVSRAIHLEMVFSLEASSFIDSLRRFCARRGTPLRIRSDNGTNFVGAQRELMESIDAWNGKQVRKWLLQSGIEWNFNPPSGSHFGGAWEREIRTVRKVLSGLLNEQPITFNDEELYTLFCEVESILNGRPLTPISDDPDDLDALTPNHLLLSRQDISFPPGLFEKSDMFIKRKWRQIQYLADLFWKRWKREYLPLLQERQKWTTPTPSYEVNDLVLLTDQQLPRNQWSLGRIVRTYMGSDGHVRVVDIKVVKIKGILKTGNASVVIQRPISKLILLKSAGH